MFPCSLPPDGEDDIRPCVTAVAAARRHVFSKQTCLAIRLLEGLGVEGDAHCGATVRHRSRAAKDPTLPNLRQVHLVHSELFYELRQSGFKVSAGDIGENVTTRGVDLLSLPVGTELRLGSAAVVRLTGLRNPCVQLDRFQSGLMAAVLGRSEAGEIVRKSGVMAIVVAGGWVTPGDAITVRLPEAPHRPLAPV